MLKRNTLRVWALLAFCLLVVGACSNSTTNGSGNPPQGGFDPGNPGNVDPAILPFLIHSVPVRLADVNNYSDLKNLTFDFTPELVGDPRLRLEVTRTGNILKGNVRFSFEDQIGFWGALLNSYGETGRVVSGGIDTIFADDEFALRVQVFPNTQTCSPTSPTNGTLYYRVRADGDTACKPVRYCSDSSNPSTCTVIYNETTCRNYLNPGLAEVRTMGSFCIDSLAIWVK